MAIVLDENRWAKEMIANHTLGKKPSETLRRVARYYYDLGNSKRETRKLLEGFLLNCNPTVSLPKWSDSIDFALNYARKHSAIAIDHLTITGPELDIIKSLDGAMIQRLAFTLLCLAKYWDVITKSEMHWVNCKDSDIMRMANINTSIRRQSSMYHNLEAVGLISFSRRVDNTNVKVNYITDGAPAVIITELRNLGFQYAMYRKPQAYLKCANCGLVVKRSETDFRSSQKYCKDCAASVKLRQSVESVMRKRHKGLAEVEIVGN